MSASVRHQKRNGLGCSWLVNHQGEKNVWSLKNKRAQVNRPQKICSGQSAYNLMGCTQVPRELVNVTVRPVSTVLEKSWWSEEVPENQKKAKVTTIFKKGRKENSGNHSLYWIPGTAMNQTFLETISNCMKDKKAVGSSRHGFPKEK